MSRTFLAAIAALFVATGFGLVLIGAGCVPARGPSDPDRATARAAILTVAEAVREADHLCAQLAVTLRAIDTAQKCKAAYDMAREALLSAEAGVDAWDAAQRRQTACAAMDAVSALRQMATVIDDGGGTIPPVVKDAIALSIGIQGVCHA